jgi:phage terminase small subunit
MIAPIMTDKRHRLLQLSPKEEAFCLAIVEGLSKSDAYRKAYKSQRAKPKTIHEKASRIMGQGSGKGC